ncbi:hypothetical protein AVBRAN9333_01550 [Campylobacter sp. RM9333]|uniref:hypothetical protein n=1 Tax=Campylobacter sp. RM9333 TaxID=2735731 RepID=UPI001D386934|nr:hypothetical protein [Campylobacter sp. RM9333]
MFKNPSLNNVFLQSFDGFYIYSKNSEIEILLKELANNLSKNHLVLYICNTDTKGLNKNIYHIDIFNDLAILQVKKLKYFDYIFIENLSFLKNINFPKNTTIIANGFLKSDLRHFKGKKTRFLRFIYTQDFIKIFNQNCEFLYNFKPKNHSIFSPNELDFDIDKEVEFYLNCIKQGFRFYDFRKSRKDEIFKALGDGNVSFNEIPFANNISKKYFYINNHKINKDFIPNNINNIKVNFISKKTEVKKSIFKKLFNFKWARKILAFKL